MHQFLDIFLIRQPLLTKLLAFTSLRGSLNDPLDGCLEETLDHS